MFTNHVMKERCSFPHVKNDLTSLNVDSRQITLQANISEFSKEFPEKTDYREKGDVMRLLFEFSQL